MKSSISDVTFFQYITKWPCVIFLATFFFFAALALKRWFSGDYLGGSESIHIWSLLKLACAPILLWVFWATNKYMAVEDGTLGTPAKPNHQTTHFKQLAVA